LPCYLEEPDTNKTKVAKPSITIAAITGSFAINFANVNTALLIIIIIIIQRIALKTSTKVQWTT
jgi:hypothetical protein